MKLVEGICCLVAQLCLTLATPWTIVSQAPLAMRFCRQEYWSRLSFPPPGDLPDPGIEPVSLTSPALAGAFFTTSATWEAPDRRDYIPINSLRPGLP